MTLERQIEWVKEYRNKKSKSVYLIPSMKTNVKKEEHIIKTLNGEIRVLVYTPLERDHQNRLPVFVNMHGGGYVKGSPEYDDRWCQVISQKARCKVFNIAYPLAPENKFPMAIYSVHDFVSQLYNNHSHWQIDPNKIAIGGHSAGGNLATAVCLYNKQLENKIPIIYQILDYPPLDLNTDANSKLRLNDDLPTEIVRMYNICYLNDLEEAKNELASPVYAKCLKGMPPALVMTAEYDILLNEAKKYADMLSKDGVEVTYKEFKGVGHGFNFVGDDLLIAEESWYLMSDKLMEVFNKN